jgi:hypothetical protein
VSGSVFNPFYTPSEMLALGVFDGTYFSNGWHGDIPKQWIDDMSTENRYAPRVSQSRAEWEANGWITPEDPLGWFQWYCRYHMGRRIPELDAWQISRWSSFGARHGGAVRSLGSGDVTKRVRQRQSLLHWAHDPEPDVYGQKAARFSL